jgi:hypothetical protein
LVLLGEDFEFGGTQPNRFVLFFGFQVNMGIRFRVRLVDDGQVVVTEACLEEGVGDYIKPYLVANTCLLLPPWQYQGGTKVVRVLALDPAASTARERFCDFSPCSL